MELHELEPGGERDVPLEDAHQTAGVEVAKPPKKGGRARLLILLPALLVCALLLLVALNWTALRVAFSPMWALENGIDRVMDPPQPMSLGFLGQVELGKLGVNCSGVVDLQADKDGLRLMVEDCTLGTDEDSQTLSFYLSPKEVAAAVPGLTGGLEGWYGLSLETPMVEQAAGTGGDPGYGWYFGDEQLATMQESADRAREALSGVTRLGLRDEERRAVTAFLEGCDKKVEHIDGEYLLHFTQSDAGETEKLCQALGLPQGLFSGAVELDFTLHQRGTLRAVDARSENLSFFLELGEYPEREPTPRLEAEWGDGAGTLTLALTVGWGKAPEAPEYQNAFSLLPRIDF